MILCRVPSDLTVSIAQLQIHLIKQKTVILMLDVYCKDFCRYKIILNSFAYQFFRKARCEKTSGTNASDTLT